VLLRVTKNAAPRMKRDRYDKAFADACESDARELAADRARPAGIAEQRDNKHNCGRCDRVVSSAVHEPSFRRKIQLHLFEARGLDPRIPMFALRGAQRLLSEAALLPRALCGRAIALLSHRAGGLAQAKRVS
jgi:hypothetical protein